MTTTDPHAAGANAIALAALYAKRERDLFEQIVRAMQAEDADNRVTQRPYREGLFDALVVMRGDTDAGEALHEELQAALTARAEIDAARED